MIDERLIRSALTRALLGMGYPSSSVSDYVRGAAKPSLDRAAEIERQIGIPAAAWAKGVPLLEMWNHLKIRSE